MNLSAVILAKNEEENLKKCLESVSFADEIILVNDYSSDNTVEIAKKYGCKIFRRSLDSNFSKQRNFGLSKASGKWVMFIDSDEEVSNKLKNEIIQATSNPLNTTDGYFVIRRDVFLGKKLRFGEWGRKKLLRLAKKNKGKWEREVHEVWKVQGQKRCFKSELFHYSHQNLNDFINNINYFSSLHSESNWQEGKRSNIFKIIFYPQFKFWQNFFVKKGFKDESYGFVISLIMSFHSFLSWSKLWLERKK